MANYFSRSANALTTGYDRSGMKNYAYSASVPGFSLTGSQPFSILTTFTARSVHHGAIIRQEGVFEVGLQNGLLSIQAPGICSVLFPKETLCFVPDIWYNLGLTFDGSQLIVYIDGFRVAAPTCSVNPLSASDASYEMGFELEAYIRKVLFYSSALTPEEIHTSYMNDPVRLDACAAWFDFSGTEISERSGHNAPVSVKGFAGIVNVSRVLSAAGGLAIYAPFEPENPQAGGYTWTAKIYPHRSNNQMMCLAANSDEERQAGWMLYLQKESDDIFRLCLRTGGTSGPVLTAEKRVETFRWADVAWVYDGATVHLYVDGELTGTADEVSVESLSGDGRTTFCGAMRRGKTDVGAAFSGYMAHVSEFRRVVDSESLKNYMTGQPYLLDEGIAAVFDFTDDITTEKCTLQTYFLSGKALITWAEDTNQLTDPQVVSIYLPGNDDYWQSLTDEQRWEVEHFGIICNSYLCDVLGYKMNESETMWYRPAAEYIVNNILPTPEFRQLVNAGSSADEKMFCALGGMLASTGVLVVLGSFVGAACKGAAFLGAALCSTFGLILLGVVAVVAIGVFVYKFIIPKCKKHNQERPDNPRLLDFSIEFNHLSNPITGGIHIRRNREQPVVPPEWRNAENDQNNPALCAYIVPVPDDKPPYIVVRIQLETAVPLQISLSANEQQGGLLGNIQSQVFDIAPNQIAEVEIPLPANLLNNNPEELLPAETRTWEWHCNINGEDYFLTNTFHKVYRLLGQPGRPWDFDEGVYAIRDYPWTDAMDVAYALYERGLHWPGQDFIAFIALGLHFSGHFMYDVATHYTHFDTHFKIEKFQRDFNQAGNVYRLNCSDCAYIVASYANLHGAGLVIKRMGGRHVENGVMEQTFLFNPILLIGYIDWIVDNALDRFVFHEVASRPNNLITDACLRLDMGDFPHDVVDLDAKRPTLPVHLNFSEHPENEQVNIDEEVAYVTAVYRERLVRNENCCRIDQTTANWSLSAEMDDHLVEKEYVVQNADRYDLPLTSAEKGFGTVVHAFVPEAEGLQLLRKEQHSLRSNSYTCSYLGSEIGIDCIECETPTERNYMLAAFLSGVTVKLPAACDLGIALGEHAFVRMVDKNCIYVVMCRNNIVLQLMCNTVKLVDLLPLALELDKQILSL